MQIVLQAFTFFQIALCLTIFHELCGITMSDKTRIIAVAGKGGVGKTSLSAAFVRLLADEYPEKRILAIDADPAVGLATALGVKVQETLDDIRMDIIHSVENGAPKEAMELLGEARFRIFDTMVELPRFSFLAIGRPESAGCYCKVNAYLKEVINLLSQDFDFVVIDGEAGIEQINRRVMEKVSHLVLVSDPSRKGTQVADTIRKVADELVMYEKCGAVINRVTDESLIPYIQMEGTEILSYISDDPSQAENDIRGQTVFTLAESSPLLCGARETLTKLEILP